VNKDGGVRICEFIEATKLRLWRRSQCSVIGLEQMGGAVFGALSAGQEGFTGGHGHSKWMRSSGVELAGLVWPYGRSCATVVTDSAVAEWRRWAGRVEQPGGWVSKGGAYPVARRDMDLAVGFGQAFCCT